ncbi:hypothetical protein EE612_027484, partial [Oryza sativa]
AKEAKETQELNGGVEEAAGAEPDEEVASMDVKDRIKKVASMKKKRSQAKRWTQQQRLLHLRPQQGA